ncbi:transforming growth factor beta-2 proprotein-like [Neocloeon triangulifer]|uniref:transforming growth factor beta-2 proprotein-like n=1 Tax=Neocloeon triangulifer TaxID=2078957 RepID=UPI00286F3B23|nr:transforming growth factor beta-2 proprotein-like [Neocloeon triangulifer]
MNYSIIIGSIILEISVLISTAYSTEQTSDAAYLQNILNTGPLSPASKEAERDSSLESYLQDQYQILKQQIAVGASVVPSQKFDLLQICLAEGNSTGTVKLFEFVVHPAPADPGHIVTATLKIYLQSSSEAIFETVQVFQKVKNQPLDVPDAHRLVSTQFITIQPGQSGNWISFNVLPAVNDWLRGQKENLGLIISGLAKVNVFRFQPILSVKYKSFEKESNEPRFEIRTSQLSVVLQADELLDTNKTTNSCGRQKMGVNFRRWGLIEPRDADVGFCEGACGKIELGFGSAEHTALLTLLSANSRRPQCVPSEYEAVAIMFKHRNGNFIIKKISRLAVKNCGCR